MSKVFDLVLGVFREPGLVADLRDKELPESLPLVIRLAAGEGAALQCALDSTGEAAETLVDASVFFLQQVLFAPGADAYRVLGADRDAPQERLRDNYRWLMKWLHPDRNQDGWEAVYADRVNVAWQDLKTPERRAEYDRRSPSTQMLAPMNAASLRRAVPLPPTQGGPLLSGSTVRRLPALVLGTLGAAAAAMIGITYWAKSETQRELSELRRDRDSPVGTLTDRPNRVSPEAPAAVDAAATNFTAAVAVREDPGATDLVFVEVEPVAPMPESGAGEAAIGETAMISGEPEPTPKISGVVATAELAPLATVVEPVAVSFQPSIAAPLAVPAVTAPEPLPASTGVPAAIEQAASVVSAPTAASAKPAPIAIVPVTPPPTTGAPPVDASGPTAVPVQVVAVPAPVQERVPAQARASSSLPASVAGATALARRPSEASASTTGIGVDAPVRVALPTRPATGAEPGSPPLSMPRVAESPAPPAAAKPPLRPAPAQHEAEALVREFASAYAAGDLARFDRLFTRASPEVAALVPMRSRFGSTEMRYFEIQHIGWHAEPEQGRVRARYRDTYVPRGARKAITESGVIEWTIRVDAGDARIASVDRDDAGA